MEEDKFKDLMQASMPEIQIPDFEDQVMNRIAEKQKMKSSVWRNIRISWIFFLLGCFFSLFITQLTTGFSISWGTENGEGINLIWGVQVVLIVVIATQFDFLWRYTMKKYG